MAQAAMILRVLPKNLHSWKNDYHNDYNDDDDDKTFILALPHFHSVFCSQKLEEGGVAP